MLYGQVSSSLLPEFILKPKVKDDNTIEIDLTNMGIGDKQGLILAKSLQKLEELSILNLHNNRLTSSSFSELFR
jgi:hypothetical protein